MGPGPFNPGEVATEMPELIAFLMVVLAGAIVVLGVYKLIDKVRRSNDG